MYFGSVRFYKHLILFFFSMLILVPATACIILISNNRGYKKQITNLSVKVSELNTELTVYKGKKTEPAGGRALTSGDLKYQSMYPELYSKMPEVQKAGKNVVYLTFDDGPSDRTLEILPILDRYNIKATFFVIGKTDKKSLEILKKIADSGHSIGIHTYSHNYNRIYQSVESYLDDFKKMYDVIYQNTNVKPDIFRFAGGSISAYNSHLYKPLIAEMTRRGFSFYDWNACGNDAMGNATKASIIEDSVSKLRKDKRYILLMHDSATMKATVSALPEIIERIEDKGFTFDKLTSEVKPIAFAYPD